MTVDFHTHIFPDVLAPKGLKSLTEKINDLYSPVTDMTAAGLLSRMDEWGIDVSVIQPVITKQSQFEKLNVWAKSITSDRLIAFGGLYPHTDDYKRDIDFLCELGFLGIKLHPEYQDFWLDDPYMLRLYDYALSKGLMLLFHAGYDPGLPPPHKSDPKRFAHVVDEMQGGVIIAAHLGGHAQWDDVERYLVGKNIYLDTSMGFNYYPTEQFLRIVRAHGADKILFGSDSPWSNAYDEMKYLLTLPLTDEEKSQILGNNAARLLDII